MSKSLRRLFPSIATGGTKVDRDVTPRLAFLGSEPRAVGLIDVYGLGGHPDFVLSDRRPERAGALMHGHRVHAFDSLRLGRLDAVVITEDPLGDYAEATAYLKATGIPPELGLITAIFGN